MKLRPIQFVYVVVLLSSLRMAGASVLPVGKSGLDGRYLGSVLCQDCAGVWTEITLLDKGSRWTGGSGTFVMIKRFAGGVGGAAGLSQAIHARIEDPALLALPVESLAAVRAAWTMRPPAAHCMTVYANTGRA